MNDLQDGWVLVCCSGLQCVAVCCGVLHCVVLKIEDVLNTRKEDLTNDMQGGCVAACCSALQCVAMYCSRYCGGM